MTTMSARDFNRDVSAAKRAAIEQPVIITDRGEASHVLLSIEHYRSLTGSGTGWVQAIQMDEDIDFDPPRARFEARDIEL